MQLRCRHGFYQERPEVAVSRVSIVEQMSICVVSMGSTLNKHRKNYYSRYCIFPANELQS